MITAHLARVWGGECDWRMNAGKVCNAGGVGDRRAEEDRITAVNGAARTEVPLCLGADSVTLAETKISSGCRNYGMKSSSP